MCIRDRLSDTTYNEKWEAKKFTINARLKILTRLMLNRVNRRVNAINPAALVLMPVYNSDTCGFLKIKICMMHCICIPGYAKKNMEPDAEKRRHSDRRDCDLQFVNGVLAL